MKTAEASMQNRSGSARAPQNTQAMVTATEEFPPSSSGDERAIAEIRASYARDGEPIATMPPPVGVASMAKTAVKAVTGGQPVLFLDKLGERLAFELAGRRLYEGLCAKHEAYGGFDGGPSVEELWHVADEELRHATIVRRAIEKMGGDPTAITPSANVHAVASLGLVKVVTDPRTDLAQSLEAILVAELADNDCWAALVELAYGAGEEQLAGEFENALETEREHLAKVRTWIAAAQGRTGERVAPAAAALVGNRRSGGKPRARSRSRAGRERRASGAKAEKRQKSEKPRKRAKTTRRRAR
jgi:hypothetical protein